MKGFDQVEVTLDNTRHYMWYKRHDGLDQRALFVVNLPAAASLADVKKFFERVAIGATIQEYTPSVLLDYPQEVWVNMLRLTSDLDLSVDLPKYRLPKNSAIVTFVDKSACQLAVLGLKKADEVEWPLAGAMASYYALKYQAKYRDADELAVEVLEALAEFGSAERQLMQNLQKPLVDDDGFTMVVGLHRKTKRGLLGKQKLAQTVELTKAAAKLKKKEKEDFYRFQLRQRKKEEMNDLLRKYKEDQERVKTLKEKKRFRPY